jgi:PhoPQ-activated pathogenicity-related protein
MLRRGLIAGTLALGLLATGAWWLSRPVEPVGPLAGYVQQADDSYAWHVHDEHPVTDSAGIVELRLTSQTWQDVPWKHRLFLIKPEHVSTEGHGLLVITGGRWRAAYDAVTSSDSLPDDAELFMEIAASLETVVAVVSQVPFQPLFGVTEDDLIALTFDEYRRSGNTQWPLLLPMVKATVRAMDAVQSAASAEFDLDLETFTVIGGSKRGWTAWLTAAVDERVTAIVPVVFDALNLAAHFPHQSEAWGAPSEKIRPYTERGLHEFLSSPEGRELRDIVDPFAYRERITVPKLIVNATNDEYFPLDSINLYWSAVVGGKYALYLPNDRHDTEDYGRLIPTLNAFHRAAAGIGAMPSMQWQYEPLENGLRLCLRASPAPLSIRVWTAFSEDRDFRNDRWQASVVEPSGGVFLHTQDSPSDGYLGIFAEPEFQAELADFTLSTTPAIIGSAGRASAYWSAVGEGDVCPAPVKG